MNLQENISRIKSMMGITESDMEFGIQSLINMEVEKIQDHAYDMGLGEMDELDEISSVDKIEVINYTNDEVPLININLYVNSDRRDYDNFISEVEYSIGRYIPEVQIIVNNIIDTRTFGSDIDL